MTIKKPLILGLGGVGSLVARMLDGLGMGVSGIDRATPAKLTDCVNFSEENIAENNNLAGLFSKYDAVISCLPYHLTLTVAEAAHQAGIHYFDPTEDVATTNAIRNLAETAKAVMVPQNGLAPGFIGIVGADIANQFDPVKHDRGVLRHIRMRVGAIPQHPIGQLGYAGNWSLEGLVHEYIAECDIIEACKRRKVPALRMPEVIRIGGMELEAFTTSGGLGTMTETYDGKAEELNYKSIRYPGHLNGMKLLIEELRFKDDEAGLVKRIANALPPDDSDRVLIHASVQGEIDGKLQTREWVADYKPIEIAGKMRTAIAWTTAASIVAVVEMVSSGVLPQQGFVKQEEIPLDKFLATKTGKLYADNRNISASAA